MSGIQKKLSSAGGPDAACTVRRVWNTINRCGRASEYGAYQGPSHTSSAATAHALSPHRT